MKIAIAVPPLEDFYTTPHRLSFMGARKAASLLQDAGHEAALFLFPIQQKTLQELPDYLSYLEPYLENKESGPTSFFTRRWRFGPDYSHCSDQILFSSPQLILISLFAFCYGYEALRLAEEIRRKSSVPIIIGGSGVSVLPEYFRNTGLFDLVHKGPIEKLQNKELLLNTRESLACSGPVKLKGKDFSLSLTISRGCPRKCRFCSNHLSQGRNFRIASIPEILAELQSTGISHFRNINFEDDNLMLRKDFFLEVLSKLKQLYPETTFTAENGLDYTLLDKETILKLIGFGFKQFNLSAGSFSEDILKKEQRNVHWQRLSEIEEILYREKLPSVLYFITGLKDDNRNSLVFNLLEAYRHRSLSGISLFYPVPGIDGFGNRARFQKMPPHLCCSSSAYPWTGSLSTNELVTAFRLSRFINLLKAPWRNSHKELIDQMLKSKKILTFKEKKLQEVVNYDKELAKAVLSDLRLKER